MQKAKWIPRPIDQEALAQLRQCCACEGQPDLVLQLLAQRGVANEASAERFLRPKLRELTDPFLIPNMRAAVERIFKAVDNNEKVALYGDYDVDGVTSLSLLKTGLRAYGLETRTFLPHRIDEGYGVSRDGLERCLAEGPLDLLIAVDCGTTAGEQLDWLHKERGVESIVLDHHESEEETRPNCAALVNPKLGQDFHYLCSAGVVFKLLHAMLKERPNDALNLRDHLDLVALATVADIVPLVEENRLLVRKGLEVMEQTNKPGLKALIEVASLTGPMNSMDLGFRLGPRLNAAGRLDTAQTSLDLLLSPNINWAQPLARELDRHNRDRQQLEHQIQLEANEAAIRRIKEENPAGLVLAAEEWHPGVVGIVASRLAKQFYRPVFVIAIDENGLGKGSGRSVEGVSLVAAIQECRDILVAGGGHEMAAGISIRRGHLQEFTERFSDSIARQALGGQLEPRIYFDAETRLSELNMSFLDSYDQLQPFGNSNPQPLFFARGVSQLAEPKILAQKHLKFELYQDGTTKTAIWFNGVREQMPPGPWDIAFYVDRNTFRGTTTLQLLIQAMRTSEAAG